MQRAAEGGDVQYNNGGAGAGVGEEEMEGMPLGGQDGAEGGRGRRSLIVGVHRHFSNVSFISLQCALPAPRRDEGPAAPTGKLHRARRETARRGRRGERVRRAQEGACTSPAGAGWRGARGGACNF